MQIGDIKVRVTAVALAVFLFFMVLIAVYVLATGDVSVLIRAHGPRIHIDS